MYHALNYSYISGQDIDKQLVEARFKKIYSDFQGLAKKDIKMNLDNLQDKAVIRDMKEKILSVALDYDKAVRI